MTTTTPTNPNTARAVLHEATDESVVLAVPGTDYLLRLSVYKAPSTPVGKRILGTIRAQARRIDIVHTGGRYIEPVYGTPRRIQGEIVATDPAQQTLTVSAGVPIVCKTDARQRADQFKVGDLVAFDLLPGASFTPGG